MPSSSTHSAQVSISLTAKDELFKYIFPDTAREVKGIVTDIDLLHFVSMKEKEDIAD